MRLTLQEVVHTAKPSAQLKGWTLELVMTHTLASPVSQVATVKPWYVFLVRRGLPPRDAIPSCSAERLPV